MKIIVGLGNPEPRFDGTRHNVGFLVLDALAGQQGTAFKHNVKFKADVAECNDGVDKVLLVKPTTYYNLVGESVRAIMDFYKVTPADILIIHDELALPFGTLRTRIGGSDAGNNGIKSLNAHVGDTTGRLRIGTWSELRDRMDDFDFVLARFTADERAALDKFMPTITEQIEYFIAGSFEQHTLRVQA
jgi:PTH1 family peptidyl-tRNA hydrolase